MPNSDGISPDIMTSSEFDHINNDWPQPSKMIHARFANGGGGFRGVENQNSITEKDLSTASFNEIQGRLRVIANDVRADNSRNRQHYQHEIELLQDEREKLIDKAKTLGVFVALQSRIEDIQTSSQSMDEIRQKLDSLTGIAQNEEKRIKHTTLTTNTGTIKDKSEQWDDRLEGIAEEYVQGALRGTELAYNQAHAIHNPDRRMRDVYQRGYNNLHERALILNWKSVPDISRKITPLVQREIREEQERLNRQAPRQDLDRTQPVRTISQPQQSVIDYDRLEEAYMRGASRARREVEPSLSLALELFHDAERMGTSYDPEDMRLIQMRVKATENRREIDTFDREIKMFHAALIKHQNPSMAAMADNGILKSINPTDMVYLFKNMTGYLESMQVIAKIVRDREIVPGSEVVRDRKIVDPAISLLDCQNDNQFLRVAQALDVIITNQILQAARGDANIARQLAESGYQNPEVAARALAMRAVNTAINTMYAFNVFEYYNSNWEGRIRDKTKENNNKGYTLYDRLIGKPIHDAMHPIDDIINEALKPEEKKPNKNNITNWATTQMMYSGIKSSNDFKQVEQVRILEEANGQSWKVVNEGGKVVLLVPPIRPTKLYGSILDANKVNIKNPREKSTGFLGLKKEKEEVSFMDALADRREIDLDNIGLKSNFCLTYASDAPKVDIIKDTFRDKKETKNWLEIEDALGPLELGIDMELRAWIYVDLTDALDPKSRSPKIIKSILLPTEYTRRSMGLPEYNFDLIRYIRRLKKDKRTAY